jgi:hypothetical protein
MPDQVIIDTSSLNMWQVPSKQEVVDSLVRQGFSLEVARVYANFSLSFFFNLIELLGFLNRT